jgi:uncharacterized membrane protein YphA (DoxX/SURF4 family)
MAVDFIALFVALPVAILTVAFVYFVRAESLSKEEGEQERETFWSDSRRVGYWASAVGLALVYILAGVPKLGGFSDALHRFQEWGYSDEFMMFIGISEFVAAILLVIPRTAFYSAIYLGTIMVGAIYTHLAFDSVLWALLPAFCLSFLAFIAYESFGHRAGAKSSERKLPRAKTVA